MYEEIFENDCIDKVTKVTPSAYHEASAFVGNGLFTANHDDEEWDIAHRVLMPQFSYKSLKRMVDIIVQVTHNMMGTSAKRLARESI